jgi:prepilin-type processing-associated H-X9-DG protein
MRWQRIRARVLWSTVTSIVIAAGVSEVIALRHERRARELEPCANRLREFWFALICYRDTPPGSGSFPPGTVPGEGIPPERRLSWVTLVYHAFDESQNVNFLFDWPAPWDSEANRAPKILSRDDGGKESVLSLPYLLPYRVMLCPESPAYEKVMRDAKHRRKDFPADIHYVGIAGIGRDSPTLPKGHPRAGVFGYDRQTRMEDIKDGDAETMMLAETSLSNGPWIAGGPTTVRGLDTDHKPYLGEKRQFGGYHPDGAMVLFVDGSVRFVRDSVAPSAFEALSTIAGGEHSSSTLDRAELALPAWNGRRSSPE